MKNILKKLAIKKVGETGSFAHSFSVFYVKAFLLNEVLMREAGARSLRE